MTSYAPNRRDRVHGAVGAALLGGGIGWALVLGLGVSMPRAVDHGLQVFGVLPDPPPPQPEPVVKTRPKQQRSEGAAAPPNLRSRATPVVAPTPVIRLPAPPPLVAAPIAFQGNQASQGNADVAGSGTGAGGYGHGTGIGGRGNGDGGGEGTGPEQVRGRIKDSDYPRAAALSGASGTVGVRYRVGVDGRVIDCYVTRSSGSGDLDDATCHLIRERFRFRPATDASGRPVPASIVESHTWAVERDPSLDERR